MYDDGFYDDGFYGYSFFAGFLAFLFALVALCAVVTVVSDHDVASEVNPLCAQHNGVFNVESDFVVCRDGKVVNR